MKKLIFFFIISLQVNCIEIEFQNKNKPILSNPHDKEAFFLGLSLLEKKTFDLSIDKLSLEYFQDYDTEKYSGYLENNKKDSINIELKNIKDLLIANAKKYQKIKSGNYIKPMNIGKIINGSTTIDVDLEPDLLYKVRDFKTTHPFKTDNSKRTNCIMRLKFNNSLNFNYEEKINGLNETDRNIFLNILYTVEKLDLYRGSNSVNFKIECNITKIEIYNDRFVKIGELQEAEIEE